MSSQSVDIIQKPFDRKYSKEWVGSQDKKDIFFQMYLQEKYRNSVFYVPFSNLVVIIDEDIVRLTFNFGNSEDLFCISSAKGMQKYILEGIDCQKDYKKYVKKLKNTIKRFLIFQMIIYIPGEDSSHAVTLIYDKLTKELEFFQRNPGKERILLYEEAKNIVKVFFMDVFGKNIKPVYNNNLCIKAWDISNLCSSMHFEFYEKIDGDCLIWALWYIDLRLKNKDLPRRQVLSRAIKIFTKSLKHYEQDVNLACKVILGYRKFIDDFTDQFVIVKTTKGSVLRIDKKKTTPLLKKAERLLKMYLFYIRNYLKM
jgi:hypothetical protein